MIYGGLIIITIVAIFVICLFLDYFLFKGITKKDLKEGLLICGATALFVIGVVFLALLPIILGELFSY